MQEKPLFLLTLISIFVLIATVNIQPQKTIQDTITKVNYYENLCKITTKNNQEIILFTNQILNMKNGDKVIIEYEINNNQTIANKIIKI
jgi:hypothetical protein